MLAIILRPASLARDTERGPVVRKAIASLGVPMLESDAPLAACAEHLALPEASLLVVTDDAADAEKVRTAGARAIPLDDHTLSEVASAYARAMLHLRALLESI